MVSETGGRTLLITDINERCTAKGFRPQQVEECLTEYEELNVWQINVARTRLTFV